MSYPPYSDMYSIVFTAEEQEAAQAGALKWYDMLMDMLEPEERDNVFRPQEAYMNRIRDTYRYSMVIKCPRGKRREYSAMIRRIKDEEKGSREKYNAVVDINPYSFA